VHRRLGFVPTGELAEKREIIVALDLSGR